ncbi:hypothetical protein HDK77DRAFT_309860 [Phyllosticta capitalensis]
MVVGFTQQGKISIPILILVQIQRQILQHTACRLANTSTTNHTPSHHPLQLPSHTQSYPIALETYLFKTPQLLGAWGRKSKPDQAPPSTRTSFSPSPGAQPWVRPLLRGICRRCRPLRWGPRGVNRLLRHLHPLTSSSLSDNPPPAQNQHRQTRRNSRNPPAAPIAPPIPKSDKAKSRSPSYDFPLTTSSSASIHHPGCPVGPIPNQRQSSLAMQRGSVHDRRRFYRLTSSRRGAIGGRG